MTSDTPDLSRPCAECQHANASNARFCNQCGSRLIESLSPIAPDFKRLTVLFGDLVGSVELSSQLDPEDWHTLLGAYQQAAGDAIRRHRGHVAQLLADEGVFDGGLKYRSMVLPDIFIDQASPEAMYRIAGMDAARIEAKVLEVLGIASDLATARSVLSALNPALILLDVYLPDGSGLTVTHQVAALDAVVEPPAKDRRPVAAPQGQAGLAQCTLGTAGVELDQHRLGRAGFGADLIDDLLRILAQFGQCWALRRLRVAGQALDQGFEGLAGGLSTGFCALALERLTHLIKPGDGFGLRGDSHQGKATCCQIIKKTHEGFLSSRASSHKLQAARKKQAEHPPAMPGA